MADVTEDYLSIIISKLKKLKDENSDSIFMTIDMVKAYYLTKFPEKSTSEEGPLDIKLYKNVGTEHCGEIVPNEIPDFVKDYSEEHHRLFYDLLKEGDDKTVCAVSSLFRTLAHFSPFSMRLIKFDLITDLVNYLNDLTPDSSSLKCEQILKILLSLCHGTVLAQKKIVELGALNALIKKYSETVRYLNTEANMHKSHATVGDTKADSFYNMTLCSELKRAMEKREIMEQIVMLFKDFFPSKPELAKIFCSVLMTISESIPGAEVVREFFFRSFIELESFIVSFLKSSGKEDPGVHLQKHFNDLTSDTICLLTSLLESDEGSDRFYVMGGFYCVVRIIKEAKDSVFLPQFYDILVLLSLSDVNGLRIFMQKQQLDLIISWLDSDSYIQSCSAALVIGNTAGQKERSEFFAEKGIHKKLLKTLSKLLEQQDELGSKCSNYLFANLSCLKNILVPLTCRKSALDSNNVSSVCDLLVQLVHFKEKKVVSKALVVAQQLLGCNAENICSILEEKDNFVKQLSLLVGKDCDDEISMNATRVALTMGTFLANSRIVKEVLNEDFFVALRSEDKAINVACLTEFSNFIVASIARKDDVVISRLCSSSLLSCMEKLLMKERIMFPLLYSILNMFHNGIFKGYRENFIGFLKTPEMETQLKKFEGLKESILVKIVAELMSEIKK